MNLTQIQSICVFCGSSMGNDEVFVATARHLGEVIACAGINLVFGAGNKGASTIGHGFATPATRHLYKLVRSVGEVITALKGQLGSAAYTNSSQL